MRPEWGELLSVKELADRMNYSENYVRAMKRDGFPMPGRRSTVLDALQWLEKNPAFRKNKRLKQVKN